MILELDIERAKEIEKELRYFKKLYYKIKKKKNQKIYQKKINQQSIMKIKFLKE